MPTATPVRPRPARLGSRLLHSPLLEALAYPHGVDRYVELLRPLRVQSEVRAEVLAVRHQTPKSVTLSLRPNAAWRGIRAGQFVNVSVGIDGVRETRPYSPAGSQHAPDGTLELTVSTHPEGLVSHHLREHARPGMILGLGEAQGELLLPAPLPERVLLICGGSGITPVMAMLRTLCDEGYAGEVGFLSYARSPQLALYGAELEELSRRRDQLRIGRHRGYRGQLRVARGYTRGHAAGGLDGRFRREHLRAVISHHAEAATFVCGPPALIDAVRGVWAEDGLPEPCVETFTPQLPSFDKTEASGSVSFARSARAAANSGLVLLEQAEDAGLSPDHGCRMGICNTCSCRKREGAVRNVLTGEVTTAKDEQIRICVSVPVGDVVLDL